MQVQHSGFLGENCQCRQARHCFSSLEHIFAGKIVLERARWSWHNSQNELVRSEPTLLRAVTVYAVSAASYFSHPLINPLAGLKVRPEGSAGSTLHTQRSWPELLARTVSVGKQVTVSPIWSTSLQGRSYVKERGGVSSTLKKNWLVLSQLYCEQSPCTWSRLLHLASGTAIRLLLSLSLRAQLATRSNQKIE